MTVLYRLFGIVLFGTIVLKSQGADPAIAITPTGSQVSISYSGKLEAAEQLGGPWLEITNAPNPFIEQVQNARRFYRARETGSIFSSSAVVNWTMTGPFQTNFGKAFAGAPDGIFPPLREKPWFDGSLVMGNLNLPVTVRVRGNSSLQECPFPKLKIKVSKENRSGTPFADAREIKIGTHCAEGGHGNIGRLRDERAAWREALAYEVMDLLGFVSPRVRRAIIEYHDTGDSEGEGASGWTVTRHAFVADDIEVVAERLGGRALSDEEVSALKEANFDEQLITDILFLHALLGNWDFALSSDGEGLWNTEVIELADKTLLPVAGDFDLASWVTEQPRSSAPHDYHPELEEVERNALYTIEGIRALVGPERFAAGRERFVEKRDAIFAQVNGAAIDDAGQANVVKHVTAFFDAITTIAPPKG